ncbi:MAG: hypothetical protein IPI97_11355 [Nitrosomonas sp.]|nr:hypothetical protein [Nitrosomonas sp.]MBK7365556.1 hypothetical protein [Nitrosomonas sp.]
MSLVEAIMARKAWKKLSERLTEEVAAFTGLTPATPNVSGRSAFRTHQQCAALSLQEAPLPHGIYHADATIQLCL